MFQNLRSDPDASNWLVISLLGFWLRYPEAIGSGTATLPERLEQAVHRFTRYGYELAILEDDLDDCIDEFRMAFDSCYAGTTLLRLKKFAVVYHVDNFYVRVHKLIENAYRLLGQPADIDPGLRPAPGETSFRKQVRDGLAERRFYSITKALRTFEGNEWIKKAVDARNLFVHQYREEREWPMLGPEGRLTEPGEDEDTLASEVRHIDQATDVDRYAARKVDELSQTLELIRIFREQVFYVVLEKLEERAPTL